MSLQILCIFNQIVISQGNYVRLWVPELSNIKTGAVHCIWTLSNTQLEAGNVILGQSYPNPIVIAPEWSRHVNRPVSYNNLVNILK